MSNKFTKKSVYNEKYRRGIFETNREKIANWVLNQNVWLEVRESGLNSDNKKYVTITIHNIQSPNTDKP